MSSSYDNIALLYDCFWGMDSLTRYGKSVVNLLNKYHPGCKLIMDLGCGSGRFAEWLDKEGYGLTLVEPCKKLLDLAKQRVPSRPSYHISMEHLDSFISTQDAIICMYDTLNHLSPEMILETMQGIRSHLATGGLFVCDINTRKGFASRWSGVTTCVDNDFVCICRPKWDEDMSLGRFNVVSFRNSSEGCWLRKDVCLIQYDIEPELLNTLDLVGFKTLQVVDLETLSGPAREVGRSLYVLRAT